MGVPKRRTSISKKGMRRSHDALTTPNLTICPHCKQSVPTHKVHKECLDAFLKSDGKGRMPH